MKSLLAVLLGIALPLVGSAAPLPYDGAVDAAAAVQHGMATAQQEHKDVLLVFGANWCEDCRDLDRAMHGSSAALIDSRFIVVKVDVGNFNRNLDLARQYDNPIQKGIPAAVVLAPDGRVLYATRAGELANARHMGERGIYQFFARMVPAAASP